MLIKLSPAVNFINVLRTQFLYKRLFSSYVLALKELSYVIAAPKMSMKLSPARPRTSEVWQEGLHRP